MLMRAFVLPAAGMGRGFAFHGVSLSPRPPRALCTPCIAHQAPQSRVPPPALVTSPDFNKGNLESVTSGIWEV